MGLSVIVLQWRLAGRGNGRPRSTAKVGLYLRFSQITSWFRIAYRVISALFLTPSFSRSRVR